MTTVIRYGKVQWILFGGIGELGLDETSLVSLAMAAVPTQQRVKTAYLQSVVRIKTTLRNISCYLPGGERERF